VYAERTFVETLPAEGVARVFCDIERGSFLYSGSSPDGFDVAIASWAEGSSENRAQERLETNEWGAAVDGDLLDLWGRSEVGRAGIDIGVEGPPAVDVEAVMADGSAELYDVVGTHVITANAIRARGVVGDLDLLSTLDGIDVETFPEPGDAIVLQSAGSTLLAVPYGLEYDLEVFADPDWGVQVTDLGFDSLLYAPDYVRAVTGSGAIPSGAIPIDVFVVGGPFYLLEAIP
jgi:hypothetical protein